MFLSDGSLDLSKGGRLTSNKTLCKCDICNNEEKTQVEEEEHKIKLVVYHKQELM